jgi:SAM-dependent methyltransferase
MTNNRLTKDWIVDEWNNPEYQGAKKNTFCALDTYLKIPPTTILDIGCGLAWESRMFNEKYKTKLWLIDGDIVNNDSKDSEATDATYHSSSNGFLYYNSLDRLDRELKKLGTTDYTLLDCNNLEIPDIKFDLITSWLSCGFHYPVSTYAAIIKKHSHKDTRVVFDLRLSIKTKEIILEDCFEVVDIICTTDKGATAEIRLK